MRCTELILQSCALNTVTTVLLSCQFSYQVRSGTSTNTFMMVDTPGMIDSPISRATFYGADPSSTEAANRRRGSDTSRGYDFEGVVKWFAERADVIMLFFDPDKPGTTSETLSILTNSLPGMDHKLYIVLNKVHTSGHSFDSVCLIGSISSCSDEA